MRIRSVLLLLSINIFALNLYGQKSIEDYNVFGDSSNRYKSIDDILKIDALHNKVLYVDIWGTRCGPCLMEFTYLPSLKERFKNDSVVFLYLCSPYTMKWNAENAILWKQLIVKHDLKGINILMSAECYMGGFYEKYKDKYSPRSLYSIPRYLLVDRTGEIVNFNAPGPSSKETLYNEIQSLLDKKSTVCNTMQTP